jgi:hypothetical protein
MLKFYCGKTRDYTTKEIDGSGEKLLPGQSKELLRVPGLHHFSWVYIQSRTLEALETNRATLIALLQYIRLRSFVPSFRPTETLLGFRAQFSTQ